MSLFGSIVNIGTLGLINPDEKAPESPTLPSPPKFAGSKIYDAYGNLSGSISQDASGNIVYTAGELSAREQAQRKLVEQNKTSLLQRLYSTPEEYTRAAQEEADAWAKVQNQAAQKSFEEDVSKIGETSNVRGLLGSKAYADIIKGREETQAKTTSDIANTTTAMRQSLLDTKRAQDYNLYNLYNSASNDYFTKDANVRSAVSGLSSQINAFNQGNYSTSVQAEMANYQNKLAEYQANDPWRNYVAPILQTGAMLYGQKSSDRRLKKNIIPEFKIGDVQFYSFEYQAPEDFAGMIPAGRHIGVMADEVKGIPGVVIDGPFGYDMVDYDVLRRYLKMEIS